MVTGSDWFQLFFSKGCATKLRVPIILSTPFLEFCVESSQICHFFSDFLCCSNANNRNKHVNTKAFVISTIIWEKWCVIWQKCRGANIFVHDCICCSLSMTRAFLTDRPQGCDVHPHLLQPPQRPWDRRAADSLIGRSEKWPKVCKLCALSQKNKVVEIHFFNCVTLASWIIIYF